jgi:hypothetical protein
MFKPIFLFVIINAKAPPRGDESQWTKGGFRIKMNRSLSDREKGIFSVRKSKQDFVIIA